MARKMSSNLNYGKVAFEQVQKIEQKELFNNISKDFELKYQNFNLNFNINKTGQNIKFLAKQNTIMTITINNMSESVINNLILKLNKTILFKGKFQTFSQKSFNVILNSDNELYISVDEGIENNISLNLSIVGYFKEINQQQNLFVFPYKSQVFVLDNSQNKPRFGLFDSLLNQVFENYKQLNGEFKIFDLKASLGNTFTNYSIHNNLILIGKNNQNQLVIKEYNNTEFLTDFVLDITDDIVKYLPIVSDDFSHQLLGLKNGKVHTYLLDNNFNIIKSLELDIETKNQIQEIYTVNYFDGSNYVNMFLTKDVKNNLNLYILNDVAFNTNNCYCTPINLGTSGIKIVPYLNDEKFTVIDCKSMSSTKIDFKFYSNSNIKKVSRQNELVFKNIQELYISNNNEILCWSINSLITETYE